VPCLLIHVGVAYNLFTYDDAYLSITQGCTGASQVLALQSPRSLWYGLCCWWRHEQNRNINPHVNAVYPCARWVAAPVPSVRAQFGQPSQTKYGVRAWRNGYATVRNAAEMEERRTTGKPGSLRFCAPWCQLQADITAGMRRVQTRCTGGVHEHGVEVGV